MGSDKQKKIFFLHKIAIIFLPLNLRFLLGAQKNFLIETVLLSTHNICFLLRNNKINFYLYTLIWRSGNVVVPFWRSFLFDKSQNVKKIQTASSLSCEIGIILKKKYILLLYKVQVNIWSDLHTCAAAHAQHLLSILEMIPILTQCVK